MRVLTYPLTSNHFHLLCEVPQAQELWAVLTISGSSAICESERSVKILPCSVFHPICLLGI